ncbi:dehydrogenase [Mycolicibacterium conceptionense]|uniref:Dehydrogenase n=1 Tax=Mycolicibacterium conceptionense TaxID=451644 RepID=A0A1A1Z8E7_9MYCO|nr:MULTISPECIES: alcohol dehydrogenase catalytic domain-containing protein [Mycolicibacterium]MCW1823666.1 alcohol dehydrogenase catalytic domain-containing protein [Mycolicibacterium senegalense]OBB05162.1 dehydrogenase [Mycolicibacterium conceptionense]OBE94395.1 dehydrogenase [Mycolicibacterium conceptionense]OBF22261.1 dehydrogenase [Mycolicibacterium conceptionense]OBF39845.1 dehydrogenase [Mycolicibacterium conceptionense]
MRAVVVDSAGKIHAESRPDPVLPGPDGAIVKVEAASICGSDLHFLEGHYPIVDPVSVGHEAVGTIVEIGPEVTGFDVGDRVLVSSVAGCGRCGGCATHDPIRCVQGPQIFGTGFLGGAQAELLAVPAANFQLLKMPEGISTEQALLLTDNLATGWAAAKRADIPVGGSVAVIGLGAVGMCALRSAITLGAANVFAVDPVEARRERAEASGAITFAPPSAQAIREATGGLGVDSVIDAVGMDASINDAIDAARAGGTVSIVGVHDLQPYPMPALGCLLRSLTIRFTTAPVQQTWPELIPLLQAGRLDVDGIFTTTMALDEAADGYARAFSRSGADLKVQLKP